MKQYKLDSLKDVPSGEPEAFTHKYKNNIKKKTPFKRNYTASAWPYNGLVNTGKSYTLPDQAMSMREILNRFRQGIQPDMKVPVFNGDNPIPELQRLDLAEREQLLEDHLKYVEQLKAVIDQNRKEQDELDRQEAERKQKNEEFLEKLRNQKQNEEGGVK